MCPASDLDSIDWLFMTTKIHIRHSNWTASEGDAILPEPQVPWVTQESMDFFHLRMHSLVCDETSKRGRLKVNMADSSASIMICADASSLGYNQPAVLLIQKQIQILPQYFIQ